MPNIKITTENLEVTLVGTRGSETFSEFSNYTKGIPAKHTVSEPDNKGYSVIRTLKDKKLNITLGVKTGSPEYDSLSFYQEAGESIKLTIDNNATATSDFITGEVAWTNEVSTSVFEDFTEFSFTLIRA